MSYIKLTKYLTKHSWIEISRTPIPNQEDYDEQILIHCKKLFREFTSYLLSIICLLVVVISLYADIQNPVYDFFQRSGALLVASAIWLLFARAGLDIGNYVNSSKKTQCVTKLFRYVEIFFLIVGTLIWAYGDLLFESCIFFKI